ncbi:uncharacterized protein LOC131253993 [Magnolia sinica]|uniref:uncharacterized protein LOC131253993 n=1 Tax=Magnolia sinica TaxID=86752 RepID=UPI00265806E6|nr:uncharacterized protein LOC131253993 [Magnolia sinica]
MMIINEPESILNWCMIKRGNADMTEVSVKWVVASIKDATWESWLEREGRGMMGFHKIALERQREQVTANRRIRYPCEASSTSQDSPHPDPYIRELGSNQLSSHVAWRLLSPNFSYQGIWMESNERRGIIDAETWAIIDQKPFGGFL